MAAPIIDLSLEQIASCEQEAKMVYLDKFGNPPKQEDFLKSEISEYPNWLRVLLVSLCALVLIFAFALSSMRIYDLGEKTFLEGINHIRSAQAAGISIVMLAEFSAILFTVAANVLTHNTTERRIFFGLAGISIVLAIFGNATVSFSHSVHWSDLLSFRFGFKAIEAFAPSLFVFGASLGIEKIALNDIRVRRVAKIEYDKAYEQYRQSVTGFETSPEYINLLATAIKGKITELNILPSQKKTIHSLDNSQWHVLVKRVMDSRNWFNQIETAPIGDKTEVTVSTVFNPFSSVSRFSDILMQLDGITGKQERVRKFLELSPNHGLTGSELAQLLGVSNATVSNVLASQNVLEEEFS